MLFNFSFLIFILLTLILTCNCNVICDVSIKNHVVLIPKGDPKLFKNIDFKEIDIT
jgi:hypothetical protein